MDRYRKLANRLTETARNHGRSAEEIHLLAVSKRQSIDAIKRIAAYGQRRFGENYLQEAKSKIAALAPFKLEWHFIGKLQSNKTREIATLFDWVHSVDRIKIAQRLNDHRPEPATP